MRYGTIADARTGWAPRPTYWLMMLMTHACKPGWQVVANEGEREGIRVAVMRGDDGACTIYALNESEHAQPIVLKGLTHNQTLRRIVWNADRVGRLSMAGDVRTDQAAIASATLPPKTLTAFTTLNWNIPD
jgi:hypothetical protein